MIPKTLAKVKKSTSGLTSCPEK